MGAKADRTANLLHGDPVQPAMKTMTLRILFTLAILAGLAAAPGAQTFRWEPNSSLDTVGARVERALEQAQRNIDRQWRTIERQQELRARIAERIAAQAERRADQRPATIERQVRARVQRQINNEIRAYRNPTDFAAARPR